ncbi:MAG: DUF3575 domain-containing protein [Muribaculaceae bacterium]
MKTTQRHIALWLIASLATLCTNAKDFNVKTNIMGWAMTSINAGVEMDLGARNSLQLHGMINPWNFAHDKRMHHWMVMPELRFWTKYTFSGHFFGFHMVGGEYNLRNIDLPFGILPKLEEGRHYQGWLIGFGTTYGYAWKITERFTIEGAIGVGYVHSPFDLYGRCGRVLKSDHRNYFGPTKLAINFCYFL